MDKLQAARQREASAAVIIAHNLKIAADAAVTAAILGNAPDSERSRLAEDYNAAVELHKMASKAWIEA